MTTPHYATDPFHSGLFQLTPSQRLMNADLLRRRGPASSGGASDSASGPLTGVSDTVGSVLGAAGYGREQTVSSDAEPPKQAVSSDGENLYHTRDNEDGTTTSVNLASS